MPISRATSNAVITATPANHTARLTVAAPNAVPLVIA